jgi:hypothetical protein
VRGKLEGSRAIRYALDSLEGNLPAHLISSHLASEFIALREKLAEMDREELRMVGYRDSSQLTRPQSTTAVGVPADCPLPEGTHQERDLGEAADAADTEPIQRDIATIRSARSRSSSSSLGLAAALGG